jgi:arylsulfatase A-like enzyme
MKLSQHQLLIFLFSILITRVACNSSQPNVVLIYADDLGYGDVSCYGASRVKTPNIDKLAGQGIRFLDAHAPSATCTPSRYAMLTGEYAWRQKGTGVLPGNAALIIQPGRTTLASLFKQAGYKTGVVGKWHLGLGNTGMDWNGDIKPGPLEIGFDYAFLMPATGDRVPCVFVENHRVVNLDPNDPIQVSFANPIGSEPTGLKNPELLKLQPSHGHNQTIINGISRIGFMSGGKSARWKDEDMADEFTHKAIAFIEKNKTTPFFLYFATHDIHVPRVPHPRFVGKTEMGPRGDAIVQLDSCVGEIMAALDRLQLNENTMVIFTSDNGPVVDDGYRDDAVSKLGSHQPAGPLRGGKYSIFEGGTREPFIIRWPARIKPGVSHALVCQIDFLASFAALLKQPLASNAGPDSLNILDAFLESTEKGRDHLVEHAGSLSLRQGSWKFISAGKGSRYNAATNTELGNATELQLYLLDTDLGEKENVAYKNLGKAQEMAFQLEKIRQMGFSRPGYSKK